MSASTLATKLACQTIDPDPNFGVDAGNAHTNHTPLSHHQGTDQNQRTYQTARSGAYYLPNDTKEHGRLDIQHRIWSITLSGGLHIAPLSPTTKNVLDLGTGTGNWAIDFARAWPNSTVTGVDLSRVPPSDDLPSNVKFLHGDVEKSWDFLAGQRPDFIHSRALLMGIHDWPAYMRSVFDALTPGGWFESLEPRHPGSVVGMSNQAKNESMFWKWTHGMAIANQKSGINTEVIHTLHRLMAEAGFVNIRYEKVYWPIGSWAKGEAEKEAGRLTLLNTRIFVDGLSNEFWRKMLGWTDDEIKQVNEGTLRELAAVENGKGGKWYWEFAVCCGQKPPAK